MTATQIVMSAVMIVTVLVLAWVVRTALAENTTSVREFEDRIATIHDESSSSSSVVDEPSQIVRGLFREVVVVTLKTGETFRGVLVAADAHALLFREAAQLAERDAVGIDGELIVPRVDIAYLQRP